MAGRWSRTLSCPQSRNNSRLGDGPAALMREDRCLYWFAHQRTCRSQMNIDARALALLETFGLRAENAGVCRGPNRWCGNGTTIASINPANERLLARVASASSADVDAVLAAASEAAHAWRSVPAPQRGEAIRRFGQLLRENKDALGTLVSLENGKIKAEGDGEVQEMIDIADFAVGQSRMLYGKTMPSERSRHRMMEQWHPLGVVGVITAFNFPVAVWAWNAMLAAVCGNSILWKPSEKTPLSAAAACGIAARVAAELGHPGLFTLVSGEVGIGKL